MKIQKKSFSDIAQNAKLPVSIRGIPETRENILHLIFLFEE